MLVRLKNSEFRRVVKAYHLNKKKEDYQKRLEQVENEIAIMKELKHPHITRLFEVVERKTRTKHFIHLVYEYCPGNSLVTYLAEQSSVTERQVAQAVR